MPLYEVETKVVRFEIHLVDAPSRVAARDAVSAGDSRPEENMGGEKAPKITSIREVG